MKKIKINHIGKTEGHFGLESALYHGDMVKARLETKEGARLMEGLVLKRKYNEIPVITSRICGVCPIVHNLTAIKALENAFKVEVTPEIILLRKLLILAQFIHSHSLHFFFLSFPDFVNINDNFDLLKQYPEESKLAIEIRTWAVKLSEIIGGRNTHPINSVVGGFNVVPDLEKLKVLVEDLDLIIEKLTTVFNFIKKEIKMPEFENPTIYSSLKNRKEYAIYEGDILFSSSKKKIPVENYAYNIEEISLPYEMVKRSYHLEHPFMVGSLARINNNFKQLNPLAKKSWKSLNVKLPCYNSFYNLMAQVVETVHCYEEIKKILNKVLNKKFNLENLKIDFQVQSGQGVGAMEAPRGTLYHYYKVNQNGTVIGSNIITPTAMFLANLEKDLEVFLPSLEKLTEKQQKAALKKLIRAYDPCISCATH